MERNVINQGHKRAICTQFCDYESSFECLLIKNIEKAIHTENLHKLMTEIFKSLNHKRLSIMREILFPFLYEMLVSCHFLNM